MQEKERGRTGSRLYDCQGDRREASSIKFLAKRARYIVPLRRTRRGVEIFMELVPDFWAEKGYLVGGGPETPERTSGPLRSSRAAARFERSLR